MASADYIIPLGTKLIESYGKEINKTLHDMNKRKMTGHRQVQETSQRSLYRVEYVAKGLPGTGLSYGASADEVREHYTKMNKPREPMVVLNVTPER
jgi:hypothetical protein